MELILHRPEGDGALEEHYIRAFRQATELYLVTAYLTEWEKGRALNVACTPFRLIIGKGFGITRKAACDKVRKWLPSEAQQRKRDWRFLVADNIAGFHPKAVFWKEKDGKCFAIIGSSNLTRAAFETNHEANIYTPISRAKYKEAVKWVGEIEDASVPVFPDWIKRYTEAPRSNDGRGGKGAAPGAPAPLLDFALPSPKTARKAVTKRRDTLRQYRKHQRKLLNLFRRTARRSDHASSFRTEVNKYWGDVHARMQGSGWERKGKAANFAELARSFLKIYDSSDDQRDGVVIKELNKLQKARNPARVSFLSEMLCLAFPENYPLIDDPVKRYLSSMKFRTPKGAGWGDRYIAIAEFLRDGLRLNPGHPARNLAELDAVIWLKYKRKKTT